MKKLELFDKNHVLSLLQKCQFCVLFKSMFILSRKACFLTRTSPNTFSRCILHNTKRKQNFKFLTITMNPFGTIPVLWVFEADVFILQKGLIAIKNVDNRFFHNLFSQAITWEYRMLQGVTGRYRGLTRGYRGLQGVTGGYKG